MAAPMEWVPRKRLRSKMSAVEYVSVLVPGPTRVQTEAQRVVAAEPVARAGLSASLDGAGVPMVSPASGRRSASGGCDDDVGVGESVSELVSCPPFLLNVEAFRKEYKRAWITVRRLVCAAAEKPFPSRSEDEVAVLKSRLALLSRQRLSLAVTAWPELKRDSFISFRLASDVDICSLGRPPSCAAKVPKAGLLTWNGDWGLLPLGVDEAMPMSDVVMCLVQEPRVESLRARFEVFWREYVQGFRTPVDWQYSVEVCPGTWSQGCIRLHIHAGWVSTGCGRCPFIPVDGSRSRAFEGSEPHMSTGKIGLIRSQSVSEFPLFYCAVEKIGSVFSQGTRRMHVDYAVRPEWIFSLLESGKILAAVARAALVGSCRNVPQNLKNLEGCINARALQRQSEGLREARAALSASARPWVELPLVTEWRAQYASHAWRYKFLVLHGPSRTGKSVFARSQSPEGTTLLVDCSNAVVPDMSEYNSDQHSLIVFDEASASMILRHKKLFQAPPEVVVVGSSATNCFALRLACYRKMMIICSNRWAHELASLIPEDRAWLQENAVCIEVRKPLWVPACEAAASPAAPLLPLCE